MTTRADGTKQTSTAVERTKIEKKDKKERKSPVRSHSPPKHHYRSASPPKRRSPSPPKHHHAASSSSVTRSVPRCSACNKKSKNGANFCEVSWPVALLARF